MGLCHALTEMFQEAMPALQNTLDEFLPVKVRNYFHDGQPFVGMCDARTQQILVIGEYLAAFTTARDADVKLLLVDRRQRTRRRDDQHFIHSLPLSGMGSDGITVGKCAVMFGNDTAIGQQNIAALNRFDLDQLAVDEALARRYCVGLQEQLVAGSDSERSRFSCVERGRAPTQFEFGC